MTAPAPAPPCRGDRYAWTQPDGAVVLVEVKRVAHGIAYLRCHHAARAWTRRHDLPLFASMVRQDWTVADLLDQIGAQA